jgi:Ras family.
MTKCVELNIAEIPIPNTNTYVDLFLHDMGGQSIFRQKEFFPRLHWKNCSYFIVCFDTTCRKSFESVEKWIGLIQSSSTEVSSWESHDTATVSGCSGRGADTSNDDAPNILLVGTKKDLRGRRDDEEKQQVSEEGVSCFLLQDNNDE